MSKINILRTFPFLLVTFIFLAANRVDKYPYSPYESLVWEIKANEGYKSWWYRDGVGQNGKQAYSIGFGWNDLGQKRRAEIKEFTKDGKVAFEEATQITLLELKKYGTLHKDPWKDIALKLYAYNCGLGNNPKNPNRLGRCCGAKWNCGNRDKNVRKSHNRRRTFERALWNRDWLILSQMSEENRKKVIRIQSSL